MASLAVNFSFGNMFVVDELRVAKTLDFAKFCMAGIASFLLDVARTYLHRTMTAIATDSAINHLLVVESHIGINGRANRCVVACRAIRHFVGIITLKVTNETG